MFLYLDIDGVLNNHEYNEVSRSNNMGRLNIDAFNEIIHEYDFKVVLSSGWRYMILDGSMNVTGFKYLLQTHGVTSKINLIGTTGKDESYGNYEYIKKNVEKIRVNQILDDFEFRTKNSNLFNRAFVIDDLDLKFPQFLELGKHRKIHFIQTVSYLGFTNKNADTIRELLK